MWGQGPGRTEGPREAGGLAAPRGCRGGLAPSPLPAREGGILGRDVRGQRAC